MPDFLLGNEEICKSCPAIGMRTIELDGYNADALRCHTDTCEMHSQLKMVSTAQAKKILDYQKNKIMQSPDHVVVPVKLAIDAIDLMLKKLEEMK